MGSLKVALTTRLASVWLLRTTSRRSKLDDDGVFGYTLYEGANTSMLSLETNMTDNRDSHSSAHKTASRTYR